MPIPAKIHIAVVGLGFGAEFVPIDMDHPDVEAVAIRDSIPPAFKKTADRFNIRRRYASFEEVLRRSTPYLLPTGLPPEFARTNLPCVPGRKETFPHFG